MRKQIFYKYACCLIMSMIEYIAIESSVSALEQIFQKKIIYTLVGVNTVFIFNILLITIIRKPLIYVFVQAIKLLLSCMLFPIILYYVNILHGTPFTFSDIKNISTAYSVLGAYKDIIFRFRPVMLIWIVSLILCLIVVRILYSMDVWIVKPKDVLIDIALSLGSIFFFIYSLIRITPLGIVEWSIIWSISTYGYVPCLVTCGISELNPVIEPVNYSVSKVVSIESKYNSYVNEAAETNGASPDIILILNETFYDIELVMDLELSDDPLYNIHSMDNIITGYAVVPSIGGGTNRSEYELLTSNSLALLQPNSTPFYSLNLANANSVISVLEEAGYQTLGSHNSDGANYNRSVGYNNLGFDVIKFVQDFDNLEGIGNRVFYTDESTYQNLYRWYSEMHEGPRFMYLLTLQNHGDWNHNDSNQNIIKVSGDYGEYTEQLDEYETCIHYSDEAFVNCVNFFSQVDRDVIVVMVGDHCPHILPEIMNDYYDKYDSDNYELDLRSTPFVIWSNNSELLDYSLDNSKMSLNYLMPTVLNMAGINSSSYYDWMMELKNTAPIITDYGLYYDANGNAAEYANEEQVEQYFYLEYSNIMKDSENDFFK